MDYTPMVTAAYARENLSFSVERLETIKTNIRKNFNEMDFENAKKKTETEALISDMESWCQSVIDDINGMTFE